MVRGKGILQQPWSGAFLVVGVRWGLSRGTCTRLVWSDVFRLEQRAIEAIAPRRKLSVRRLMGGHAVTGMSSSAPQWHDGTRAGFWAATS